jgi:hypothetical protein
MLFVPCWDGFCGRFCVGPKSNYWWFRSISLTCHIEPPPFGHTSRLKISRKAGNKIGLRLHASERRPKTLVQPSFIHTRVSWESSSHFDKDTMTPRPLLDALAATWQLHSARNQFLRLVMTFLAFFRKSFFSKREWKASAPFIQMSGEVFKITSHIKIPLACTRKRQKWMRTWRGVGYENIRNVLNYFPADPRTWCVRERWDWIPRCSPPRTRMTNIHARCVKLSWEFFDEKLLCEEIILLAFCFENTFARLGTISRDWKQNAVYFLWISFKIILWELWKTASV